MRVYSISAFILICFSWYPCIVGLLVLVLVLDLLVLYWLCIFGAVCICFNLFKNQISLTSYNLQLRKRMGVQDYHFIIPLGLHLFRILIIHQIFNQSKLKMERFAGRPLSWSSLMKFLMSLNLMADHFLIKKLSVSFILFNLFLS